MKHAVPVALDKGLVFLDAIIRDRGTSPLIAIAARLGIPPSTAYRLAATLAARGLIAASDGRRYLPGGLMISALNDIEAKSILAQIAKSFLTSVVTRFGQVAHLGILESGMVTYSLKVGSNVAAGFTQEGMQLEAYCSGIGKVLLADMPPADLEAYLSAEPFVRLTPQTIVDPQALRLHLAIVKQQGFALDNCEVVDHLKCIAVPLHDHRGMTQAAISISAPPELLDGRRLELAKTLIRQAALGIERRLYPWKV